MFLAASPADDDFNAGILDRMADLIRGGCDIVCACRFMPGGAMQGCPWLKATLVRTAALMLNRIAALPTKDPTSGFRMFSRRAIAQIEGESDHGSTELRAKWNFHPKNRRKFITPSASSITSPSLH